ncbi:hypothetical protein Syun_000480 [Stephania yunnanensis]|uniref:Reverse transcriptase zinc-binding domain-containing protein n=1 Tax=Stephania yunnanensis TaxID=152371 RepID=A0AAP0Q5L5_9MAGN
MAPEKMGHFSVKSACRLAVTMAKKCALGGFQMGESSTTKPQQQLWSTLWKTNVPKKLHMFIWKALHIALPTKERLTKRKNLHEMTCQGCGINSETIEHLFFHRPQLRAFLFALPLGLDTLSLVDNFFEQIWEKVALNKKSSKSRTDVATHPDSGDCGVGWILLDFSNKPIWAGSFTLRPSSSVEIGESWAILNALSHYRSITQGLNAFFDAKEVIEGIMDPRVCPQDIDPVRYDIRSIRDNMGPVDFFYVPRTNNVMAHNLAQNSLRTNLICTWSDQIPEWVFSIDDI